ncbi:DUF6192 family protein [Streptomyces sp. NPDC051636]|uniref:DUF6192 family protein n=1 Tax=Streptomyces sp. NPDC051636 TaxID=3365663 RepID=UPI0037BCD90F
MALAALAPAAAGGGEDQGGPGRHGSRCPECGASCGTCLYDGPSVTGGCHRTGRRSSEGGRLAHDPQAPGQHHDEQERFETVTNAPPNPRGGQPRWTRDGVKRMVDWKVDAPLSVQKEVEAIHDLAADDSVTAVTTDFLRRSAVASKAMADDTARPAVNEAQFVQEEAAPQLQRMELSAQFMDLVAACAQLVTTAGRIVPNRRGEHYNDAERDAIGRGLARVSATADLTENAVTRAR